MTTDKNLYGGYWRRLGAAPRETWHKSVWIGGSGRVWQCYLVRNGEQWDCHMGSEGLFKQFNAFTAETPEAAQAEASRLVREVFV